MAGPRDEYDLVVIGGGPTGEKGAAQAAYFGHRTALIEKEQELGGACINTGTLASKTLRESALFLTGAKSRQLYGINTSVKSDITLADFMYRKHHVQERERARASKHQARHGIDRIHGSASFVDANTIEVRAQNEQPRLLRARVVLVATGSIPARPGNVPFNSDNVFDSDTVLEMRQLPKSMVVAGGGVIASEYACLFAALGIKITLVHRGPRLMEFVDGEIIEALTKHMTGAGIELVLNDQIETVKTDAGQVQTTLKSGKRLTTDSLLYAIGRCGNTAGLGLEKLGIAIGKYGHIEKVDPQTFQTSVPNIYAAGDVIGPPALAATGMEQGRLAMCHAFGLKYREQRLNPILPAGIYTIPEISSAGESEESCRKNGTAHVVGRSRFGDHARGQIIGDTEGMIKLVFSAPEGKLLGVHVIGELASELAHIGMGCLHFGGGVDYFIQSVFNYPTLSDVYKYAAFDALGQLNKIRGAAPPALPRAS
jgi:NAD(P) transhydrogenase